jgi:hypothetical protein
VEFQAAEVPTGCMLVMTEHATSGPVALVPTGVTDPILHARNAETLRRLALLAEKRS